jgi:eukaryotic-like serine/threonine-protein kinase
LVHDPLIQLAILKGIISADILATLKKEDDPLSYLVEQGFLESEDIEKLKKELALDGFETIDSHEKKVPSFAQSTEQISVFGRYIQLEFLGQGGMARVFKAIDPTLNRTVALKIVKVDDPRIAHRLLLEARSQARIEHENVCKIYEAGEVEGKPYIAMQHIAGETLKQIKSLNLKQKVELIRQVAEGVHAAHRAGLIHRDLKPSNILIEQRDTGPIAYVVDFGLAHENQGSSQSMSELVVGTPAYMSPEQAKGEKHKFNASTDVYGIGATLYEIVTGRAPFEGASTTEILMKVVDQEPVPPRKIDRTVPTDLQTIIMKCLEKNPERRYKSARSLSDDLSRFLDGDPILAKRATLFYRFNKKVKKYPIISGLIAAAVVAVIIFAAIAGFVQWRAKEQAKLFQEFGQEVTRIEAIMRYAYLLPLHDVQNEKNQVVQRLNEIRNRMNLLGKMAYGPGYYSIGRGYLSLHHYQAAYDNLMQAWQKYNYHEPEVANALGLSLAMLYQEKLGEAGRTYSKDEIQKIRTELRTKYRDPALKYIRLSTSELPEYTSALIAFLEEDYAQALKQSEAATKKVTWLYEGHLLQGNVFVALGNTQQAIGKTEDANKYYESAKQAYVKAAAKGQSDPEIYEGLCALHASVIRMQINHAGTFSEQFLQDGINYCKKTQQADSKNINSYLIATVIFTDRSFNQRARGIDDSDSISSAIKSAQSALKIEPENSAAHAALGQAIATRADAELDHGQNPIPSLDEADFHYRKALAKMPMDHRTLYNLGGSLMQRGRYESSTGKDATRSFENSLQYLEKATKENPTSAMYLNQLCLAYFYKGEFENQFGLDPRNSLEHAIAVSQKSSALNPAYVNSYIMTAATYLYLADAQIDRSQNAIPSLDSAINLYNKSLTLDPKNTYSHAGLGIAFFKKGLSLERAKKDPLSMVSSARDALRKSIEENAEIMETYSVLAEVELLAARDAINKHQSPVPVFNEAQRVLQNGLSKQPDSFQCLRSKAFLHLLRAQYLESRGQGTTDEITEGIEAANRSLKQNSQLSDAYAYRGKLFLLRAKKLSGSESRKAAQQAQASFEQAFKINKFLKKDYTAEWQDAQRLASAS